MTRTNFFLPVLSLCAALSLGAGPCGDRPIGGLADAGGDKAGGDAAAGGDSAAGGDAAGKDSGPDVGGGTRKCGGIAGVGCPAGQFCDLPAGMCGGADLQGTCVPTPQVCPAIYAPVCGCDGKTYGNDCERQGAGAVKAHDGECKRPPDAGTGSDSGVGARCGGIAGFGCDKGLYCELPPGTCHSADLFGSCQPVPGACTKIYKPVCGCDSTTYGNDCELARKQVAKDHDGECKTGPDAGTGADGGVGARCGGIAGLPCDKGLYCELPAGSCGSADLFGSCQHMPGACPAVYKPVCGCDGVTYGNDCERAAKGGVTKAHDGECKSTCGGSRHGSCSASGVACQCCPAGGPTQNCTCSTACKTDADCLEPSRPLCNRPAGATSTGFCTAADFKCCWACL